MLRKAFLLIFLSFVVPGRAEPCLFVAAGVPPDMPAVRVLVTLDAEPELAIQVAYRGASAGQRLGLMLPIPAGATLFDSESAEGRAAGVLGELQQDTDPLVLRFSAGCGSFGTPPPELGSLTNWENGTRPVYDRATVDTIAQVDSWLAQQGFNIGTASRQHLIDRFTEGDRIALVAVEVFNGTGALRAIRLSLPEPRAALPLVLAADACVDDPFEVTVFAVGAGTAAIEGWDSGNLDELDRDTLRSTPDLETAYRVFAGEHDGRLFVVEYAQRTSEITDLFPSDDVRRFLDRGSHLTRLRAIVGRSAATRDPEVVLAGGVHLVDPVVDLRPDPRAHGASVLGRYPYLAVLLLLLVWTRLRRR